jgi:hypothetical protein
MAFFEAGCKHAETIQNTSKTSFSVMFCVSAAGDMLPPMLLFKNKKSMLYKDWCKRAPNGTCFLSCDSGWFGRPQFNKWFTDVSIPTYCTIEYRTW